jgi:hypothetical protein
VDRKVDIAWTLTIEVACSSFALVARMSKVGSLKNRRAREMSIIATVCVCVVPAVLFELSTFELSTSQKPRTKRGWADRSVRHRQFSRPQT